MKQFYPRFPHLKREQIVFVARDQLWLVSSSGGLARKIDCGTGVPSHPYFSPDGKQLAFTLSNGQCAEVSTLSLEEPTPFQRRTFLGESARVIGWRDQEILFTSSALRPFVAQTRLYALAAESSRLVEPSEQPYGAVASWSFSAKHGQVLCRYEYLEASAWKRYRGGSRGDLWIDRKCDGDFASLALGLDSNLSRPCWAGDRLYFLSDHELVGHLYSCSADGDDVRRHSNDSKFYARHLSTDGERLIFIRGGELLTYDPVNDRIVKIEIDMPPLEEHWALQSATASTALQDFSIGARGSKLAVIARGQVLTGDERSRDLKMISQISDSPARVPRWLDAHSVLCFRDGGDEASDIGFVYKTDATEVETLELGDLGRVLACEVQPGGRGLAIANQRHELLFRDLTSGQSLVVDRSKFEVIEDATWSPDGNWLVYSLATGPELGVIKMWNVQTGELRHLTDSYLRDRHPTFDTAGRYLYFVSARRLSTVTGNFGSSPNFASSYCPCVYDMQTGELEVLPLAAGEYQAIWGSENSAIYLDQRGGSVSIFRWDRVKKIEEKLLDQVFTAQVSADGTCLAALTEKGLTFLNLQSREERTLDLAHFEVAYDQRNEWRALLRNAWTLQRDFFFDEKMGGVDWPAKWRLYEPMLEQITTRAECSDLIWQLNGELATSHSYEFYSPGGTPPPGRGYLGAEFRRDGEAFVVSRLLEGNAWAKGENSPLPPSMVGCRLKAVNGEPLVSSVGAALDGLAGQKVQLSFTAVDGKAFETEVQALSSERPLRYIEWQKQSLRRTMSEGHGRVGYLHVPNTYASGFAEFQRQYLHQLDREALILDLRFNTGGNLGEWILDRLSRRAVGRTLSRGFAPTSFPPLSRSGPLIVLINGFTGSDGELLAELLRLTQKALLVGTSTWGGVTGSKGRTALEGGGYLTQPRTVFEIQGGPSIENRGVRPDLFVDEYSQDEAKGLDSQLSAAISEALRQLS